MKKFITTCLFIPLLSFGSELDCLTSALYHEARNLGVGSMKEVANVISNRVKSNRYPNTYCKVVKQNRQFSFYPGKPSNQKEATMLAKSKPTVHDLNSWNLATKIAIQTFNGRLKVKFTDALFYHTTSVDPNWASEKQKLGRLKNHIYYGEK